MSDCDALREALVEAARGLGDDPAVRRHVADCPACAARLADEQDLTKALALLAAADAARDAPPGVEERLRARVRALDRGAPPMPARLPRRLAFVGLAAAVLAALAASVLLRHPQAPRPAVEQAARPDDPAEFAPLVYGEPLEGADALHLTRVRVPRSALASFGWPAPPGDEDGPPVEAEVLVGQDGLARGIRFVSDEGGGRRDSLPERAARRLEEKEER